MITGHGKIYRGKSAKNALNITLKTVLAMKHAALKLMKQTPKMTDEELANIIFERVSEKRNFDSRSRIAGEDYNEIDMVGLLYWAKYARKVGK
jgi:hypothetical protein